MKRRWPFVAIISVTACGTAQRPAVSLATRDSAGVRIVESAVPGWGDSARWTVDTVPTLTIGETDGAAPYVFSRIAGAVRRDDGSIVVADDATRELRMFDSSGHFMMAAGRHGQGPAEFGRIERIARCGADQLWVDAGSRISIWDINLKYLREFTVTDNIMWPLVCFGGAGVLVKQDIGDDDHQPVNVIYFDSLKLMVLDSVGASRRDLMQIPLWAYLNVPSKRIGFPHPFGRSTLLAGDGPNVVVGFGERMEVRTYSREGKLLTIARGPKENLELTSAMREEYHKAPLTGEQKQEREGLEAAGNPMPKTVPAYTDLAVDRVGNTWLKRFELPLHPRNRWAVFGRDGQFLGHLSLPPGLEPLEIGADYILGRTRDSLSVEQVRLFRLHK